MPKPRERQVTKSVAALIEDSESEVRDISAELQEWLDGMPESLQGGAKADQLTACIEALESLSFPPVPESIRNNELEYTELYHPKGISRPKRMLNVISQLQAAAEIDAEDREDVGDFLTNCDALISDLESIELPGMF